MVTIDNLKAYKSMCRAIINQAIRDSRIGSLRQGVLLFMDKPIFGLYCDMAQVSEQKVRSIIRPERPRQTHVDIFKGNVKVKRAVSIEEARRYTHERTSTITHRMVDMHVSSNGYIYRLTAGQS